MNLVSYDSFVLFLFLFLFSISVSSNVLQYFLLDFLIIIICYWNRELLVKNNISFYYAGYFCCECVRLTTLFVLVIMISPFLVTVYLCSCRSCFSRRSDSVCSEESVVVVEAGAITCCQWDAFFITQRMFLFLCLGGDCIVLVHFHTGENSFIVAFDAIQLPKTNQLRIQE